MTDAAWKYTERVVAAMLGGTRVPVSGRQRGATPDIQHARWSIEVKRKQALPKWLFQDAFEQADASNPGHLTPLVIVEWAKGRGHKLERFAVVRLEDFVEMTSE